MRGVENIEGPSPSLGYMFATRSIVHVVGSCTGTACTVPLGQIGQAQPVYSLYIRKFTQLLVIRTKLANWPNWGINVEIATKSGGQIRGQPRFKTGQLAKNWQIWRTCTIQISADFKSGQKTGQSHVPLQSHKHQKRCPPAAPSGTTGGTTITSETRKTPLIEDLLDPNRPRNGLIDG